MAGGGAGRLRSPLEREGPGPAVQLPFALIPLVKFTSSEQLMGEYALKARHAAAAAAVCPGAACAPGDGPCAVGARQHTGQAADEPACRPQARSKVGMWVLTAGVVAANVYLMLGSIAGGGQYVNGHTSGVAAGLGTAGFGLVYTAALLALARKPVSQRVAGGGGDGGDGAGTRGRGEHAGLLWADAEGANEVDEEGELLARLQPGGMRQGEQVRLAVQQGLACGACLRLT